MPTGTHPDLGIAVRMAAAHGYIEVMSLLLEHGADVEGSGDENPTSLCYQKFSFDSYHCTSRSWR